MQPHIDDRIFCLLQAIKNPDDSGEQLSCMDLMERLYDSILKITVERPSNLLLRSQIDPVAYIEVWIRGRYAYLLPSGSYPFSSILAPRAVKISSYRDYSYNGNADKFPEVSEKEWEERCNIWMELAERPVMKFHLFEPTNSCWEQRYGAWGVIDFVDNPDHRFVATIPGPVMDFMFRAKALKARS